MRHADAGVGEVGSSYVVRVGDEKLLFDCGPATTWKLVRNGISPTEIDKITSGSMLRLLSDVLPG